MAGPQEGFFTPLAYRTLFGSRYVITPASNRMGYRLEGPRLEHAGRADMLSDATPVGSIQVPASGQPILLMADRRTTGGYPKIGVVISADLPLGAARPRRLARVRSVLARSGRRSAQGPTARIGEPALTGARRSSAPGVRGVARSA